MTTIIKKDAGQFDLGGFMEKSGLSGPFHHPSPALLDKYNSTVEALGGRTMTSAEFGHMPGQGAIYGKDDGTGGVNSKGYVPPGVDLGDQQMSENGFDAALAEQQAKQAQAEANMKANVAKMQAHMKMLEGTGAAAMYAKQALEEARSKTERRMNPSDSIPAFPGNIYTQHLFNRNNVANSMEATKKRLLTKGTNIISDHLTAIKTAIKAMGVFSERNPNGIPIDIKDAKKVWFGEDDVDSGIETEWRTMVENGENTIDPKKVRQFVNYDGSKTWELLNDDKTVMSRFTLGEIEGMKIFVQGGYNKFAEKLNSVRGKLGAASGTQGFEGARMMGFGG